MAASTCTETSYELGRVRKLTFDVVFHSTTGAFTDYTVVQKFNGLLIALETNPGATAPTNLYDITMTNANGHDVLEGVGANRATATTERVAVVFSGTTIRPPVTIDDTLTLKIANQSVNSAITQIVLYYQHEGR